MPVTLDPDALAVFNAIKEANRLTYWLGLPALLFSQLASL